MFIDPEMARELGFDENDLDESPPGLRDVDDDDRVDVEVRLRGGLDADGVLVEPDATGDPDSPDKTETVTWPGR